jgi:hypothetical protein
MRWLMMQHVVDNGIDISSFRMWWLLIEDEMDKDRRNGVFN